MPQEQNTLQPGTQVWVQFDGSTRGRNMRLVEAPTRSSVVLATGAMDTEGKRYSLATIVAARPAVLAALADQARELRTRRLAKDAALRKAQEPVDGPAEMAAARKRLGPAGNVAQLEATLEQAAAAISATSQVPPQDARRATPERRVDATARHAVYAQDTDGTWHLAVRGLDGGAAYVAACQPTTGVLRADTTRRCTFKAVVGRYCQECRHTYAAALDRAGLPWYTRKDGEPDPATVGAMVARQTRLLSGGVLDVASA